MCLKSHTKCELNEEIKIGYKIVEIIDGVIKSPFLHCRYNLNEWYNCERFHYTENLVIIDSNNQEYEAGFHIITSLEDARVYLELSKMWGHHNDKIVKVEYKEVVANGPDDTYEEYSPNCDVARKMKIVCWL